MLNKSTLILLGFVLTAFAGNSILNRLALVSDGLDSYLIDPTNFTVIRLFSGAVMLIALIAISGERLNRPAAIHYRGAFYLFVYAITFSYAYISLDAAVGALILFGVVQICIISIAIFRGKKLGLLEWLGCSLAIVGLLVLTLPNVMNSLFGDSDSNSAQLTAIPIVLMVIAGVAWGLFTINGAGSKRPLIDTGTCFLLSIPLSAIAFAVVLINEAHVITFYGAFLAILSGAITSGLGYALWYKLLPLLTASQAASSQLLVPIIASLGGGVVLGELLTLNFIFASILTLGGVFIVIKSSTQK